MTFLHTRAGQTGPHWFTCHALKRTDKGGGSEIVFPVGIQGNRVGIQHRWMIDDWRLRWAWGPGRWQRGTEDKKWTMLKQIGYTWMSSEEGVPGKWVFIGSGDGLQVQVISVRDDGKCSAEVVTATRVRILSYIWCVCKKRQIIIFF